MIRYQYIWSEKVLKLSHLGRIWLWDQIWHPWGKGWIDPMKKKVLKHNLTMWTVIKYKVMAFLFLQAWICPLVQERFVWEKLHSCLFLFYSVIFQLWGDFVMNSAMYKNVLPCLDRLTIRDIHNFCIYRSTKNLV